MNAQIVYEIPGPDGKTDKEINLLMQHNIPLGSLVEVGDDVPEQAGCRLYVVQHNRDCDGTPLYSLSFDKEAGIKLKEHEKDQQNNQRTGIDKTVFELSKFKVLGSIESGYPEDCLKIIK